MKCLYTFRNGILIPLVYTLLGIFLISKANGQAANLEQWRSHDGTVKNDLVGEWSKGDINHTNSHYEEGYSVPYRSVMTGLTPNQTISLVISFEITRNNPPDAPKHALDYITSFDRSKAADPLLGVTGVANTSTTYTLTSSGLPTTNPPDVSGLSDDEKKIYLYGGGTISDVSYSSEGDVTLGNQYAFVKITFTPTQSTAVLLWGGHLALSSEWGGLGAGTINGSPYHMRLDSWLNADGEEISKIGRQDVQVQLSSEAACTAPTVTDQTLTLCENNTTNHTATFDLTAAAVTTASTSEVTITYYSDEALTQVITTPTSNDGHNGDVVYAQVVSNTGGCSDVAKITLQVNPLPAITLGSNPAVCYGATSASINYSGAANNPATYSIAFDATAIADGFVNVVDATLPASPISIIIPSTAKANTVYNATLTVSNGTCTSASYPVTITINPLPPCTITRTDATTHYSTVGATASFSGPTPSGTTYTYAWSLSNNTSGAPFVGGVNNTQTVSVKTATVGSYTLTLTVTDNTTTCSSTPSCTYVVTVTPIGPSITYTQGFYGNSGGKACNGKYSYQIMQAAVPLNGSVYFGIQNPTNSTSKSFKLNYTDISKGTSSNIYKMLPGGSTPYVLKPAYSATCNYAYAQYGTACTYPAVPMSSTGSINNVLLAQTMALYFNISYSNSVIKPIGGLILTGNVLTFVKPTTSCGFNYPTTGGTTQTIPCSVYKYLSNTANYPSGASISNLLDLANRVLGGLVPATTISASDMNSALDIINKGFDGGAQIIAVTTNLTACGANSSITMTSRAVAVDDQVTELAVSAYPNPYTDRLKLVVSNPKAGNGNLEVYNMLGQKVKVVYNGYLPAGTRSFEFNVPSAHRSNLIYILRVGDKQVSGKVFQAKE